MGDRSFDVSAGEDEADIVAGLTYLNNLRNRNGQPIISGTFVTAVNGGGVNVIDNTGRYVMQGGVPKFYSWEYLRTVGRMARADWKRWAEQQTDRDAFRMEQRESKGKPRT